MLQGIGRELVERHAEGLGGRGSNAYRRSAQRQPIAYVAEEKAELRSNERFELDPLPLAGDQEVAGSRQVRHPLREPVREVARLGAVAVRWANA
jgi:hypothetical protein